ncbi:hypothetical protein A7985_07335 [Pseudoalteromonas luteoviolacea]|uniref:Lipoprotein n=1 Tax=Pseudoalteromonas luteoviolacea TaxID=43657 RepID=A0A1C0TWX9_9GAMM|nr:hypothetical protein [Pseudoalteromonas luteoviolacea]OCQ23744.1 hypothetical protein A7985_07335 [Pseudoalteromonas luteoviolacea]
MKLTNLVLMLFLVALTGCQSDRKNILPLTDTQRKLIKLGYKHDSWPIKFSKNPEEPPENKQLFAILLFEKYFGSNKLDLIEKPLEKVNKTSLDIVFIEDKKNFIVIEVAYYEHGHEKSKKTFNSDIKSESFFQFDSFYIKMKKAMILNYF